MSEEHKVEVLHADGTVGRIVVARIRAGADLIRGIEQICKDYGIDSGLIVSLAGSLKKVIFGVSVRIGRREVIDKELQIDGPMNVIGGSGFVSKSENGEVMIHVHATVYNVDQKVYGGHLVARADSCLVFRTLEIAIQEVKGIKLLRKLDNEIGFTVTFPLKE